ncbi:MerR family transcriptional regulator [Actinomadura sp. PM05-2]|uniref:MerR family transcriptional regulator n=2 Tax=Actinomadura parmotrematis TaxID=2864039 RepID=A0ABS7G3T3_9ACTN|nr:MerR family transcriptional regulator [Actinomadura parmotrematis]
MTTYRIDDLAHAAGTTVRNVRNYQERGLLPPPRREGRVGIYDDTHLARIRMICRMQERGHTFATIAELLGAWQRGADLGDLLGLEKALTDPWDDERPERRTAAELLAAFGLPAADEAAATALERATALGLVRPDGDAYAVPSPRLLRVGAELVAAGVPLDAVLAVTARIREHCAAIAAEFVGLAVAHGHLGAPAGAAAYIDRLRPLAQQAVQGLMAEAMSGVVEAEVDRRIAGIARTREP